jgi:hypothetical protein
MKQRLRRLATAGNAAALVLLVVVLANGRVLFEPGASPGEPPPQLFSQEPSPPRVLLVVIDALRVDASEDGRLMPNLHRMAGGGASGVAIVESWIPSTVAGIRTIAEGIVPPPASFLHDFGTSRAPSGGIFEPLSSAGLRAFAAGPRLWSDLYGPWLAGSESLETFASRDERILRAGLEALGGGYDLIVVHLSETDDAAHLHGGRSPEYREAVRRADAALGTLVARAGPRTTVIVTSDHGATDEGGHAGPEREVVETPVVARGPGLPRGDLGTSFQRDLPRLILSLFRLSFPDSPSAGPPGSRVTLILLALGAAGGVGICGSLLAGREQRRAGTVLNGALWAGIALASFGLTGAALLLALATLGVCASPGLRLWQTWASCVFGFGAGTVCGALRLLDGAAGNMGEGVGIGVICGLGLLLGLALRALVSGVLTAILPVLLLRLMGETASLSTLDVDLAFRLAAGPWGLTGAMAVTVLAQALPVLAVLAGFTPALVRSGDGTIASFSAGMALAVMGQLVAAGLTLALRPGDQAAGSVAVGLLVRLCGELTFLFLGSAVAVWLGRVRRRAGRPRPPAAMFP